MKLYITHDVLTVAHNFSKEYQAAYYLSIEEFYY